MSAPQCTAHRKTEAEETAISSVELPQPADVACSSGGIISVKDVTELLDRRTFYKAVGDEVSVVEYITARIPYNDPAALSNDPPRDEKKSDQHATAGEWQCFYMQCSLGHAKSTVEYRWDMGYARSNILAVTLFIAHSDEEDDDNEEIRGISKVLLLSSPLLSDITIPGNTKAAAVKQALGYDPTIPLSVQLFTHKTAIIVQEIDQREDVTELVGGDHREEPGETFSWLDGAELIVPRPLVAASFPAPAKVVETIARPKWMTNFAEQ